jgi:hypothetical protein
VDGDDDRDRLQPRLTGRHLGLVQQEEGGTAGREGEDDAEADDDLAALAVVAIFHFHECRAPP